jgi:hypothetical protein
MFEEFLSHRVTPTTLSISSPGRNMESLSVAAGFVSFKILLYLSGDPPLTRGAAIMSLSLSGGLGAILSTFFGLYMPQGHTTEEIVYLLTFPALFIGIGITILL